MAVAGNRGGEEVEQRVEDERMVAEMYKYGGAFSLVGLEFFYRPTEGAPEIRVRLDSLLRDGETYRATDVRANTPLEDGFQPKELRIGLGTRERRDPVIKLLRQLKMPTEPYIDPLLNEASEGLEEFQTPGSQGRAHAERREAATPMQLGERLRGAYGNVQQGFQGRGRNGGQFQGAPMSPQRPRHFSPFRQPFPQQYPQQFEQQYPRQYQPGFRPPHVAGFDPYMQMGARMESPYPPQEMEDERARFQMGGTRGDWREDVGADLPASPSRRAPPPERYRWDSLEERMKAMEESRKIERERNAMSSELRRLQSGVSPFEHPGVYAHVDELVTMHELPSTWGRPLQVSGAAGNVLIADNVKLAFLKEALWEFTKRKCAEAGEVLTDRQVRDIEAQTMEFYGKQRVEAKKIMEKARINPNQSKK